MKHSLLLTVLLLAAAQGLCLAADVPTAPGAQRPLVFLYGAQDPDAMGTLAAMGMTAVYIAPDLADAIELAQFSRTIDIAAEHGLKTIIGIPTVSQSFDRLPSVGSDRYRGWAADLIERVVTRFKDNPHVVAWATGDFLEDAINYNAADFRAFLARKYGTVSALNASWGTGVSSWGEVHERAALDMDKDLPFSVGRASVDVAEYRRQSFHDVMAHWADEIRRLDTSRPIMTGRISRYRGLASVPDSYDIVCPYMDPGVLEDDGLTHNVHAVDMARRANRFTVIPCLAVPTTEESYARGDLERWIALAGLHGARGVGFADRERIDSSSAPGMVVERFARTVLGAIRPETFACRPEPTIAFLYEPYASGLDVGNLGVYGYLDGFSAGEPSNPFSDFRVGCCYGLADYITLTDLPLVELDRYGVVLAPMALNLPENAQDQLRAYVRKGGALVADLGAGMYQTGSWLQIPEALRGPFGIESLVQMRDYTGELHVSWTPAWAPSLKQGTRTTGTRSARGGQRKRPGSVTVSSPTGDRREQFTGTAAERQPHHISGPVCFAVPTYGAGALATLTTAFEGKQRVISGIIGNAFADGIGCFATHRLWADWASSGTVYEALHHDLCIRRAKVKLLNAGFWTSGSCVTSTTDGVAMFNARNTTAPVDAIVYAANDRLYSGAVVTFSALARREDGTRAGTARLSLDLAPVSLAVCRPLAVRVQPYTDTCSVRLVSQSGDRLVLEVAGDGTQLLAADDRGLCLGAGAEVDIRFTVTDGGYPVAPRSTHTVQVRPDRGRPYEYTVTATPGGELRFSELVSHAVVTLTPAPGR